VEGYRSTIWIRDRTEFLRDSALWMWNLMNTGGNILVYDPNELKPEPRLVWEKFRDEEIDEASAKVQLQIIHPLISRIGLWTPSRTSV
jgi:hypothetical protein